MQHAGQPLLPAGGVADSGGTAEISAPAPGRRGRVIERRGEKLTGAKKCYAATVLAAWLITIAFFMVLSRTLDLEVFFVLSLIGLLVIAVLIDGAFSRPRYMRHIGYLIAAGVAIFAYIVAQKILEILAA